MNKRIIAVCLSLVIIGSLLAGCKNAEEPAMTTGTQTTETTVAETEVVYTTIPGIERNDFSESDFEDVEETTEATEENPDSTEATEESTEETQESTEETLEPSETEATTPATDSAEGTTTEFEWYNSLSGAEQQEFMNSFDSVEAFFAWYNAAKSEYETQNPGIEISGGTVDLEGQG